MDWIASQLAEVAFEQVACALLLKCVHWLAPAVRRGVDKLLRRSSE